MNDGVSKRVDPNPTVDNIHIFKNFLPEDLLDRGHDILDNRTLMQWPGNPIIQVAPKFNDVVREYLQSVAILSTQKVKETFKVDVLYPTDIQLGWWGLGGGAGTHTDTQNAPWCMYSSIIYLSGDFEGGKLWFPELDFEYKPERNDFICFPSDYVHQVDTVTAGTRRTIIDFYAFDRQKADYDLYKNGELDI